MIVIYTNWDDWSEVFHRTHEGDELIYSGHDKPNQLCEAVLDRLACNDYIIAEKDFEA